MKSKCLEKRCRHYRAHEPIISANGASCKLERHCALINQTVVCVDIPEKKIFDEDLLTQTKEAVSNTIGIDYNSNNIDSVNKVILDLIKKLKTKTMQNLDTEPKCGSICLDDNGNYGLITVAKPIIIEKDITHNKKVYGWSGMFLPVDSSNFSKKKIKRWKCKEPKVICHLSDMMQILGTM
ncbi:MAG: hypothetical protein ACOC2U_00885 [bacterium]